MNFLLIQTIALLCQVTSVEALDTKWSRLDKVASYQLECQRYYITCFEKENNLNKCIMNREIADGGKKWKK